MKKLITFFFGMTLAAFSVSGCVSQDDVDNFNQEALMIWAATALDTNFRISVQVNANSLNNQGTANVSVYTGSTCSGSAVFNENNLTSSKTFLLTEAGTYSVRASFGASSVCSSTPITLSASKRTSACSVNLTTVDCL